MNAFAIMAARSGGSAVVTPKTSVLCGVSA